MAKTPGTLKTNFRDSNNRIDWAELCTYIHSQGGYEKKKAIEWAKQFGTSNVTLAYKYKMFVDTIEFLSRNDMLDYSDTLAKREINIKKERAKLTHQRKVVNKVAKELAVTDLITEEFIMPAVKPIKVKKLNRPVSNKKGEQAFFITDTHYLNEEVSAAVRDFAKLVVDNWDGSKTLKLVFGGDYVENRHHVDQMLKAASSMEQAVEVGTLISAAIGDILNSIDVHIETYFLIGNHDSIRQGNERAGDNLREHIVGIISKIVDLTFKEERNVVVIEPASYYVSFEDFGGKSIRFTHGHIGNIADKSIQTKMIDNELQTGVAFDHYVFGHFHRFNDWTKKGTTKRFTICPAMKTYDSNFENANVLRSTVGITMFRENGIVAFVPWEGEKKKTGELTN